MARIEHQEGQFLLPGRVVLYFSYWLISPARTAMFLAHVVTYTMSTMTMTTTGTTMPGGHCRLLRRKGRG